MYPIRRRRANTPAAETFRAASSAASGSAGDADGAVVLLRAANVIRNVNGRGYVVKLRGRILLAGPGFTAVDRNIRAAVVRVDHALRIVRRDPQIVLIAVPRAKLLHASCRRRRTYKGRCS